MIDKTINILDEKDVKKAEREIEATAKMERGLRGYGTELAGGGYIMTVQQLQNYFVRNNGK